VNKEEKSKKKRKAVHGKVRNAERERGGGERATRERESERQRERLKKRLKSPSFIGQTYGTAESEVSSRFCPFTN